MFVYNVKVSGSKLFKVFFCIVMIGVIIILGLSVYKIFSAAANTNKVGSCVNQSDVSTISAKNYTNILKSVHDNLDTYVGQQVHFSGYVYRVYDFNKEQFVLARNMVISPDLQTVVVGFLCNYEKAIDFADGSWIEITGQITKGNYHGEIPVLKIKSMKQVEKPQDELVYPPDDAYVPTSGIV